MGKERRKFSAEFKLDTVLEGIRGEKSIAEICRERDITDSLYYKWRDVFKVHAPGVFATQRDSSNRESKETQIAELERMVGRLTMENDILKKARTWLDAQYGRNGR